MKLPACSMFFLILFSYACKDSIELPCQELRAGLADSDQEAVAPILNDLLKSLSPDVTPGDMYGHEKNLDVFVDRLNDDCDFEADIVCYACIETFPPISEVQIHFDSSGISIQRTIDIRTPQDELMTVTGIHK